MRSQAAGLLVIFIVAAAMAAVIAFAGATKPATPLGLSTAMQKVQPAVDGSAKGIIDDNQRPTARQPAVDPAVLARILKLQAEILQLQKQVAEKQAELQTLFDAPWTWLFFNPQPEPPGKPAPAILGAATQGK